MLNLSMKKAALMLAAQAIPKSLTLYVLVTDLAVLAMRILDSLTLEDQTHQKSYAVLVMFLAVLWILTTLLLAVLDISIIKIHHYVVHVLFLAVSLMILSPIPVPPPVLSR